MRQRNDFSRSLVTLEQDSTLIAVIEMGQSRWLVAGIVPGIERQSLKKLSADQDRLLQLLHRWRKEAAQAGHTIKRIAAAYGFWLARWLRAREIKAYVIHPSSVPVLQRAGIRTASAEALLERKLAKIGDLCGS